MKKLILSAAAVFALTFANAQEGEPTFGFSEGNFLIEGNIGFGSTNDKNSETKTSNFNFNPKAGYFISDDLAIGLDLGFGSNKTEINGTDTTDRSYVGIGGFARYYFLDLGARFKTYGEFGLGYETANNKIADVKTNTFRAGATLGINYFVTENFAINFALADILSYSSEKADVSGAEAENEFNFGFGQFNNFFSTAQFGLTFKF